MAILKRCVFLCGWLALASSIMFAQTAPPPKGDWSKDATSVSQRGAEPARVSSPDARKTVTVGGDYIRVTDSTVINNIKTLSGLEDTAIAGPAELLWAPDSRAFAITSSDPGLGGTWLVSVFSLTNDAVKILDVTSDVQDDFKTQYRCSGDTDPNIAAIAWTRDSSELLVVAQVPPQPSCPEKGKLAGYIVSVPTGQILSRLSESQLRERWGNTLGPQLPKP